MLRLLASPKWIAWHVLTLGAMVTCGFLSAWQWHRAGSALGSGLNIGYGVQWPIFAVFFGVMWWRFLRMEIRDLRASGTDTAVADADPAPGERSRGEDVDRPGSSTDAAAASPGAAPTADPARWVGVDATPAGVDGHRADGGPHGRSPFTPRPAGVEPSRLSDPQIRAYNDALAELAARDREN